MVGLARREIEAGHDALRQKAALAPPKRRQPPASRRLCGISHTFGSDVTFARIDCDEDLAGPFAGSLVFPAVVTELA